MPLTPQPAFGHLFAHDPSNYVTSNSQWNNITPSVTSATESYPHATSIMTSTPSFSATVHSGSEHLVPSNQWLAGQSYPMNTYGQSNLSEEWASFIAALTPLTVSVPPQHMATSKGFSSTEIDTPLNPLQGIRTQMDQLSFGLPQFSPVGGLTRDILYNREGETEAREHATAGNIPLTVHDMTEQDNDIIEML